MEDPGLIPGLGRYPGEGNGNPIQYSCLGNSMDSSLLNYRPCGYNDLSRTCVIHFFKCIMIYFYQLIMKDFIFWGSQITADGDCRHEIKKRLLLRRKAMTNLDSILKSRDITLPTDVCLVKAMVFPVVVYGCGS